MNALAALGNPVMFVGAYLLLMLPTYVLPYFGSNSVTARVAAEVASQATRGASLPIFFPFWLHLLCLAGLCVAAFMRGKLVNRAWLLVFPFLALVFDLVPLLTWIPLVPTVMHLLAIILGVAGVQVAASARESLAGQRV